MDWPLARVMWLIPDGNFYQYALATPTQRPHSDYAASHITTVRSKGFPARGISRMIMITCFKGGSEQQGLRARRGRGEGDWREGKAKVGLEA